MTPRMIYRYHYLCKQWAALALNYTTSCDKLFHSTINKQTILVSGSVIQLTDGVGISHKRQAVALCHNTPNKGGRLKLFEPEIFMLL